MRVLTFLICLFAFTSDAQVDSLVLKNGTIVSGEIVDYFGGNFKIDVKGDKQKYAMKDVQRIYVAEEGKRKDKIIEAFIPYAQDINKQSNTSAKDPLDFGLPLKEGKIYYSGVINVDSVSKDELFDRARIWFVNNYASANAVLQLDDKANGRLIGKGFYEVNFDWGFGPGYMTNVWHTISVSVKDNKYKYEITDFKVKYYQSGGGVVSGYNVDQALENWENKKTGIRHGYYEKVGKRVSSTISNLDKAMKSGDKTDNDW